MLIEGSATVLSHQTHSQNAGGCNSTFTLVCHLSHVRIDKHVRLGLYAIHEPKLHFDQFSFQLEECSIKIFLYLQSNPNYSVPVFLAPSQRHFSSLVLHGDHVVTQTSSPSSRNKLHRGHPTYVAPPLTLSRQGRRDSHVHTALSPIPRLHPRPCNDRQPLSQAPTPSTHRSVHPPPPSPSLE